MLLGYARVSTDDQSLVLQRQALSSVGCQKIFAEKRSGAERNRPELQRLLSMAGPEDVLIVSRLDRLARSTRDLLEIAEQLKATGTGLRSLAEPWADTTSPSGRMVLTIFAGVAEFERALIRERTAAGRRQAVQRGVKLGRPSSLSPSQLNRIEQLYEKEALPAAAIADLMNVHTATIYRALRRINQL
jgi:DNA invertase Pin-like site-specific DNA recombinase